MKLKKYAELEKITTVNERKNFPGQDKCLTQNLTLISDITFTDDWHTI